MCNCQMMARDFSETQGGAFAASIHAPLCEDFKQLKFSRVTFDLGCFVVPADEVDSVCENIDGPYKVEALMLTQDQFDKLPEYDG